MPIPDLVTQLSKVAVVCVALTLAAATAHGANAAQDVVLNRVTAQCASCHGPTGLSPSSTVPRLNGQHRAYLIQRLKGFLDLTRQSPHARYVMWDVAADLTNERLESLAAYYAAQTPSRNAPEGPLAARGALLFLHGAPGVPACRQCHGPQGDGAATTPRIAGQHAAYLNEALIDFSTQARVSATMNHPALQLTEGQIKELVAYLAKD
jgi:cytochrome c553